MSWLNIGEKSISIGMVFIGFLCASVTQAEPIRAGVPGRELALTSKLAHTLNPVLEYAANAMFQNKVAGLRKKLANLERDKLIFKEAVLLNKGHLTSVEKQLSRSPTKRTLIQEKQFLTQNLEQAMSTLKAMNTETQQHLSKISELKANAMNNLEKGIGAPSLVVQFRKYKSDNKLVKVAGGPIGAYFVLDGAVRTQVSLINGGAPVSFPHFSNSEKLDSSNKKQRVPAKRRDLRPRST